MHFVIIGGDGVQLLGGGGYIFYYQKCGLFKISLVLCTQNFSIVFVTNLSLRCSGDPFCSDRMADATRWCVIIRFFTLVQKFFGHDRVHFRF